MSYKIWSFKSVILFIAFIFQSLAHAYIPELDMIIDRTGQNHGRGMYRVNLEVVFPNLPQPHIVKETWIVNDNGSMRLLASGKGLLADKVNINVVYSGGLKYYLNSNGVKKAARTQPEFLEYFFYFQNDKKFKSHLAGLKIIPAKAVYATNHVYSLNNYTPKPNPYVQLSRVNGSVNYLLTQNRNDESASKLWISQDLFDISKIKFSKDMVLSAFNYTKHSRGLRLPSQRKLLYNGQIITINLLKVTPLVSTAQNKALVFHGSLKGGNKDDYLKLSGIELIDDFYKNFR